MMFPEIYDLRDESELLSTGETEELTARQDEFNRLFEGLEQTVDTWKNDSLSETVWEYYEDTFDDDEMKQVFFEKVGEIESIPSFKYVLKYLLLKYKLAIGDHNLEGLWNYLSQRKWEFSLDFTAVEVKAFKKRLMREQGDTIFVLQTEDYRMLLSVLVYYLKIDYQYSGMDTEIKWNKYFKKLVTQFDQKHLNDLALALNMDYQYYCLFRKKVLKQSEINFYDRENVLLYLVLNYAKVCGIHRYYRAYDILNRLYPQVQDKNKDLVPDTTKVIGQWLLTHLEEYGRLKEAYRLSLFKEPDQGIAHILEMVDAVDNKNGKRSAERIFLEQWKKLEHHFEKYEKKVIFEKIISDKEKSEAELNSMEEEMVIEKGKVSNQEKNSKSDKKKSTPDLNYMGKQKIYRWLYGENILRREKNRNVELKDKEMRQLGDGNGEFFLDSKLFLETRIRDNTFSAFPKNEERQRNLLLTLGFLNFVFESDEGNYMAEVYSDRLVDFEIAICKLFAPCGFQLPHSGNAYDVYIKLLLSCDEPIELFKHVWRMKTDSLE